MLLKQVMGNAGLALLILITGYFLYVGIGRQSTFKGNRLTVNLHLSESLAKEKREIFLSQNLPEIPVLSYHQVRDWKSSDSKTARVYIMPVALFAEQMQTLADSGYNAILPEQLTAYLEQGGQLPKKPVMITFDDGTISQFENALPLLNKVNYKAVFFIMTVTLNRSGYLSNTQVQALARQGNTIGCHTWDHHRVTQFNEQDWDKQILKPKTQLQNITGMGVKYFAYPYGAWNAEAVSKLKDYGFDAAFQLSLKSDKTNPVFTVRRIIVDSHCPGKRLLLEMKKNFE